MTEEELKDVKEFTRLYLSYGEDDGYTDRKLELINESESLGQMLLLINKGDVLSYLNSLHTTKLVSEQEIANRLFHQWTTLEKFHNSGMSKSKMLKFMKMADKSDGYGAVYNDEVPKVIAVYRGTNVENHKGLSWTRDKEVAEWFAKRFLNEGQFGYVFSGQLAREDVIANFTSRNEAEIICDWKKVKDIQCEKMIKTCNEIYKFR